MNCARWIGIASVVIAAAVTACAGSASTPAAQFLVKSVSTTSGGNRLEVVASNGHVVRILSRDVDAGALSPNKRLVAYEDAQGLFVQRLDGKAGRLLVPCGGKSLCAYRSLAWSPDSTKLLVASSPPHNSLSVVSVSTGRSHQIVKAQYETNYSVLAWSESANKIAFIARHPTYQPHLVVADPNGRSRHTICGETCGDPAEGPISAWSPDGKWIVYSTINPGFAIFDLATGATNVRRVHDVQGTLALWAPDSSRFAMGTIKGTVEFFSPAGSKLATIDVPGAYLHFFAWNFAGMYFVKGAADPDRTLYVIPTGQSTAKSVFSLPKGQAILWAEPLQ